MVEVFETSSPDGLRLWPPTWRFSKLFASLEVSFEERFLFGEADGGGEKVGNVAKTFGDAGGPSERLLWRLLLDTVEELVVRLPPRKVPAPVEPLESIDEKKMQVPPTSRRLKQRASDDNFMW